MVGELRQSWGLKVIEERADADALAAWQIAEAAELADVELPVTRDDFELSVQAWLGYVPVKFWPFVATWVAAIRRNARVPLSAGSLKAMRGMMRRDVDETTSILWDAKPAVIAAWAKWYPDWVVGQIAERATDDPWFLAPAEDHHRHILSQRTRDDTAQKAAKRDREIGRRLYEHMDAHGGMVRWRPGLLAVQISARRGKRVNALKVAEMGAALVRIDVARWRLTARGEPWALVISAQHPPKSTKPKPLKSQRNQGLRVE